MLIPETHSDCVNRLVALWRSRCIFYIDRPYAVTEQNLRLHLGTIGLCFSYPQIARSPNRASILFSRHVFFLVNRLPETGYPKSRLRSFFDVKITTNCITPVRHPIDPLSRPDTRIHLPTALCPGTRDRTPEARGRHVLLLGRVHLRPCVTAIVHTC